MVDGGNGVLPNQLFGWNIGAKIENFGAHIAVRQLEPGPGKSISQGLLILMEAARDRFVEGIKAQGKIGRGHHRPMLDGGIVGIGNHVLFPDIFS